ncbi:Uncharacterised protein [Bordetella pertussis]|nr:Uncharacterised protein [Bordetella pertussis]
MGRLRCVVPALLTTMSSPSNAFSVAASRLATAALSETSARTKTAWPPAALIAAATRWPPASLISATATLAPSRANAAAMPSPKPEPAPVTMAVLPFNRILCLLVVGMGQSCLIEMVLSTVKP